MIGSRSGRGQDEVTVRCACLDPGPGSGQDMVEEVVESTYYHTTVTSMAVPKLLINRIYLFRSPRSNDKFLTELFIPETRLR